MSVISLLQNTKTELHIYVMTAGCEWQGKKYLPLDNNTALALEKYAKTYNTNNSVTLIDVSAMFIKNPVTANLETRFTPMCMLRLFADKIEILPDKILYLDYDIVCLKDIEELYGTNIENYELGGVLDRYGKWFFRNNFLKFDYINSGVLLLNMKKIKMTGLFTKCQKLCAEKKMLMPDQSAINKLSRHKLLLPQKYNEQKFENKNTVLRHFSTFFKFFPLFKAVTVKPWQTDRMHSIMKTHRYDDLTNECKMFKNLFLQN